LTQLLATPHSKQLTCCWRLAMLVAYGGLRALPACCLTPTTPADQCR